jgi:hypothetical protein
MQIVDMMRGDDRLVQELAGVNGEDDVLVVCDTSTLDIGTTIAAKAGEIAKDVVMNVIRVYRGVTHGQEPPRAIAEAMKAVDVVLAAIK